MKTKELVYFIEGKKRQINVQVCDTVISKFCGLMFRKNSPPLLFLFNKNKTISIHSFFCRPFRAIWLDENMKSTKVIDVKNWRPNFSGRGRYLLEIPLKWQNFRRQPTE